MFENTEASTNTEASKNENVWKNLGTSTFFSAKRVQERGTRDCVVPGTYAGMDRQDSDDDNRWCGAGLKVRTQDSCIW